MKSNKLIIAHGAPGCGKTTLAARLHKHFKSPWFEFGWIPEFTHKNPHTEISYRDEEQMSFENLMLVVENYICHGFENVILSDLNDIRIFDIAQRFLSVPHIVSSRICDGWHFGAGLRQRGTHTPFDLGKCATRNCYPPAESLRRTIDIKTVEQYKNGEKLWDFSTSTVLIASGIK